MTEQDSVTPQDELRGEDLRDDPDPDEYQLRRAERRYEDWMMGDK